MFETIKKLFAEYLKTVGKIKLIILIFSALFLSALTIIEPIFFAKVISYLEEFLKNGTFEQEAFLWLMGVWGVFTIMYIGFSYFYRYYLVDLTSLQNHNRVFIGKVGDILKMSYGEYLGKKTGSIYKNFDRGTGVQFSFPFFFFKDFLRSIFNIMLIFFVLIYVDWQMTLISLSLVPVMVFFGVYVNKKTIEKQKQMNKEWDSIFGKVGDSMTNFLLSKTLLLEKKVEKELIQDIDDQYGRQTFVSKGWSVLDIYTVSLIQLSRILVLGAGTYFILQGDLAFYELFLFYSYLGYIFFPLSFIFGSLEKVQKEVSEAERFYTEFDDMEVEKLETGKEIENLQGNIEFHNVAFAYTPEKNIFKNLSFSIKQGETVAFVGNTGAGKSTIVNLLLRLWDIEKGKILLDGENIQDISKESLRKHIGIVTQEVGLFNDTLRQNLLYARPDATEQELQYALEKSQADFVKDMPKGMDTVIGERGMKLSGGEKQRIAIARLFLKNPEILVLDEATSALDNKTEVLVQKALDTLMKGKTSMVIAHRLSTIQNADTIFLLEDGEIVETGKYEELMKKGGKFAELASPKHLVIG